MRNDSGWEPKYPEIKDAKIKLLDDELMPYVIDNDPGITVKIYPVIAPACFFIDSERVFLRINWNLWGRVNSLYPEINVLVNSDKCTVTHEIGQTITHFTAPVYHIDELPQELLTNAEDEAENTRKETEIEEERKRNEFIEKEKKRIEFIKEVKSIVKEVPIDVSVFDSLRLGGNIIPLAISTGDYALILEIMLSDDIGSEDKILKKLQKAREDIEKDDIGDAKVLIGILCDEMAMAYLNFFKEEKMAGVNLIPINHLEENIISIFG